MPMGKAALFVEPYHFEMTELPTPPVNPGGVLVQITSAGICGSDLHYWRGEMKPILSGEPGPVILGHEQTGVVHTLGQGVTTDSMGRPLAEGALDFLARTKDRYPLSDIMSHSFPLERIGDAFEQAEWAGKSEDTAITRAFLTP